MSLSYEGRGGGVLQVALDSGEHVLAAVEGANAPAAKPGKGGGGGGARR